jgi:hypothetical protein
MSVRPSFPPNAANSRKSDAAASPMDEVGKGHYLGIKYLRDDRALSSDIPGRCPRAGFAGRNPVASAGYS